MQIETKKLTWTGFNEDLPFKNLETNEQLQILYDALPSDIKDDVVKYGFDNCQDKLFIFLLQNQLDLTVESYYKMWDLVSMLSEDILKYKVQDGKENLLNFFLYQRKFNLDFKKLENGKN